MCVILDIEPGKFVPTDMLDVACDINKHGFGLSWVDNEILVTERDTSDNDPKRISDLLQKRKANRLFLHLRHATKGKVISENSHPFIGLDKSLGFMHNGTLYDWTPNDDKYSDSKCIFDCMIQPLGAMARKFSGPDWLRKNGIFRKVIGDYCKGMSVFVLYDNRGHVFRVNEKQGKQYEGFWASNDYSFKKSHYRSSWGSSNDTTPFTGGTSTGLRGTLWTIGQMDLPGIPVSYTNDIKPHVGSVLDFFNKSHGALASKPGEASRVYDKAWDIGAVKFWLDHQDKPKDTERSVMSLFTTSTAQNLDAARRSFQDESGYSLHEIMEKFSERDLETMAESFPKAVAALVVDLFIQNETLIKKNAEITT